MMASGRGEIILLAVAAAWGTTFLIVKEALDAWPPLSLIAVRFALGALPFAPLLARRGALAAPALRHGVLLGFIFFAGFALQTYGLRLTSPARSAFFTAVSVPLVPVLRMTWTRERPVSGTLLALACACGGIVLLLGGGLDAAVRGGDLLSLACAVVFAVQIIALSEWSRVAPALALTGVTLATTALLAAIGALALGERLPQPITRGAPSLVYLGLVATALTIFAQTAGQRLTTANRAAFIFALEPAFAVLFAWIMRGHRLTSAELAGGALLVVAAIVADRRPGKRDGRGRG